MRVTIAVPLFLIIILLLVAIIEARMMAPMRTPRDPSRAIPGRYIVRLKTLPVEEPFDSPQSVMAVLMMHVSWLRQLMTTDGDPTNCVHHVYNLHGLHGYAGELSDSLVDAIRGRPEVEYVEPDQVVYLMDNHFLSVNPEDIPDWREFFKGRIGGLRDSRPKAFIQTRGSVKRRLHKTFISQKDAPWGLQRLSNERLAGASVPFKYPESAGSNVDVYVIDTGINVRHQDFEGRAKWGKTIPLFDEDIDGNGHGTHCAGIIAGHRYGVAKQARLHAVKVLMTSGFGTNADVIKGIEWVIKRHFRKSRNNRRSVANMSLGGGKSETLEEAVNLAVRMGIHFAVAAGNDNEDACEYSPAAAKGPITVGAMDVNDVMAYFSNWGKCVDVFAPGVNITSAWIGSRLAFNTISGTSMASPHVAGVLALYLGEREYTPKQLKRLLIKHSRRGVLSGVPSATPNRLVCIDNLLA